MYGIKFYVVIIFFFLSKISKYKNVYKWLSKKKKIYYKKIKIITF